jgi:hypothetical protein
MASMSHFGVLVAPQMPIDSTFLSHLGLSSSADETK